MSRVPGRVSLPPGPVDAWVWRKRITGTCSCDPGYASVVVEVNGAATEVPREEQRFSVAVALREGANHIVARCRHHDGMVCQPAEMTVVQRLKARPKAVIDIRLDGDSLVLDGRSSLPCESDEAPISSYRWRSRPGSPVKLALAGDAPCQAIPSPRLDGEYYITLTVTDAQGRSDTATDCFAVERGVPCIPDCRTENPGWIERAVVYGMAPHNCGPDGLRSVIGRLDDLKDLGIDAMWLAPCTGATGHGHGYAVTDYFSVRRDYGTKRDFGELVRQAHARGIRVLMDFVPNHTSVHHPYMEHAARHGVSSPYRRFYEWQESGEHFAYYFDWRHLPNLNYDSAEVRRWMIEAFCYWVREFDVDGFRVDAAWGVKLRRPGFWSEWRRELKRIKPDLLLLAEASARDPDYFTEGFDAAYDWTDEPGRWAWEEVFDDPGQTVARLRAALTNDSRGFHRDALIFRFLNNNDTGRRFITRYGEGMERVAAAMLLTLPGLPCLYMGQEVGAEFEPYKTPGAISWEGSSGVRGYYKHLIALRRRLPSLCSRQWEMVPVESDGQVLAYVRYGSHDDQPVLVLLNFSEEPVRAIAELSERSACFAEGAGLVDAMSGDRVRTGSAASDRATFELGGLSARLIVSSDGYADVAR